MSKEPTDEEKYLVVDGRRWRREDPHLPDDVATSLRSYLGRARSAVAAARRTGSEDDLAAARERVGAAKHGLGERGTAWWEQTPAERRERWTTALASLESLDPDATDR